MTDKPTIGFMGIGRMGAPMAGRLIDAAYPLVVCDPHSPAIASLSDRGAKVASTPRDAAGLCDIVFASLPTPDVVQAAALGPDGAIGGSRMKVFVDLSTAGPAMGARLAKAFEGKPARLLDCPVSGGVAGASKGTLTLMAAGSDEARRLADPVLSHFGRIMSWGSMPGHGQMIKVINNLLSVVAMAASSEAAILAERAGLDPRILFEVVNASSGASNASQTKIPRHILTRTYDFGFATSLSQKDVRLCLEQADALGVPMLVGSLVRQVLTMTAASLGADVDFTMVHKALEQLAGAHHDNPRRSA